MPWMRFRFISAEAMIAPVLPAETKALATPRFTIVMPTLIEASRFCRTACAGCSSIPIASLAWTIWNSAGMPPALVISDSMMVLSPTSATSTPSSAWASMAPATICAGAKSPPMASSAMSKKTTPQAPPCVKGRRS